ncbi:MAG: hypothetical protein ABL907_10030 [Hyphomicrobium sp.]
MTLRSAPGRSATLRSTALASAMLALAILPLNAEEPGDGRGRYALSPVEGGVLRLDKETGSVAFCARKAEQWSCDPVEDKAHAIDERTAKLEAENKALKERIAALELNPAGPGSGDNPAGPPGGTMQIPSEEEVDKALDYVERIFKKFRDRLQKLDPPKTDMPPEGGRL